MCFIAAVAIFTVAAAITDFFTRKVPNQLTVSAFAAAVILHTVVNGFAGLGFAMAGFATGFGILLVLWLIGGGGGGDVKLMGALGAWLGASLTLQVFFVGTALAAVAAAGIILSGLMTRGYKAVNRRYLASASAGGQSAADEQARRLRQQRRRLMPFAIPVALGTWLVLAVAWQIDKLPYKLPW